MLHVAAPLQICMIEAFDKMLKDQNTSAMKSIRKPQVNENNMHLQNSLVVSVLETDKLAIRHHYKNLLISGVEQNENEHLKGSVIRFKAEHGKAVKPEEIDDVTELKDRYVDKYKFLLMCQRYCDHLVVAKFAAIGKRNRSKVKSISSGVLVLIKKYPWSNLKRGMKSNR